MTRCRFVTTVTAPVISLLLFIAAAQAAQREATPPTLPAVMPWERHIIPIPIADWITEPATTTKTASELCDRIAATKFGTLWPQAGGNSVCRDFVGDGSMAGGFEYWVHRCQSTEFGGGFYKDFYFLGGDSTGTMERISWVAESPKAPREWRPLLRSLVDGFARRGAKIVKNNDSTYAILQLSDRSISIELYFDFQKPAMRRLTVECMSARLAEAAQDGELLADRSDLDSAHLAEATPEAQGDEDINEGMSFRIIEAGERFLREHAGSEIAPEVELGIAQAHETIWCLANMSVRDPGVYDSEDFQRIRKEGPSHRVPAIILYQDFLAARRESPGAPTIRKRLIRLRNAIDTGYYKYWFPGD